MSYDSIVLASASLRRSQLLTQIGVRHESLAADLDEDPRPGESPADYVQRLARDKALAGLAALGGADGSPGARRRHDGRAGRADLRQAVPANRNAWRC